MEYLLVNAKVIGKPKNELFDVLISNSIVASIYPAGVDRSVVAQIDLQGAWVAPGFVDAHVHTTNTGVMLSGLNLSDCKSYEHLERKLASVESTDSVVIGHGWDDSNWARKADTSVFAINAAPIYISRIDAHSALVSQSLLNEIPEVKAMDGYKENEPIRREAHGYVREYSYNKLTAAQRKNYQNIAFDEYLKNGICEIHEMAGPKISSFEDAKLFQQTAQVRGIDSLLWWGELGGHTNASALGAIGCGGDLFIDGSFGSKTAFVNQEYSDGGKGFQFISQEDAVQHILNGYEYGLPTSFHVIGDAAIEVAANAFEEAKSQLGSEIFRTLTHRLEHAEFLFPQIIEKLVALNITLSMQPKFSSTWAGESGMYKDRLGQDWKLLNPFMPILKAGGRLLFGSDSPVTDLNPWKTIHAAMNMHNPDFSITQKSAFRASTTNFGKLQIGDTANLAIWNVEAWAETAVDPALHKWSTDSRSFPTDYPDSQNPPECLMTIVEGKIIFSKIGPIDE